MKLIDKEKVIKEVKKVYDEGYKFLPSDINESVEDFKYDLLRVLDTLEVKEVDLEDYISGIIDYPFPKFDFPNIYPNYKELKNYCNRKSIKDGDRIRLIIVKEK